MKLFGKRYSWWWLAGICTVTVLATVLLGPVGVVLLPFQQDVTKVALLLPAIPALLICASLLGEQEHRADTAVRRLRGYWVMHAGSLLVLTTALILLGWNTPLNGPVGSGGQDFGAFALLRNLFALTAINLLGYRILGAAAGWAPGIVLLLLPAVLPSRGTGWQAQIFGLINRGDNAPISAWFAGGLCAAAALLFALLAAVSAIRARSGRGRIKQPVEAP